MKIYYESWHYRFIDRWNRNWDNGTVTLCSYFWNFIFSFIVCFLVVASGTIFSFLGLWSLLAPILQFFTLQPERFIIAGYGLWIVIFIISLTLGYLWFYDNSEYMQKRRELAKCKQPNFVFEYIRAKKRKVCPIIEFDYEED